MASEVFKVHSANQYKIPCKEKGSIFDILKNYFALCLKQSRDKSLNSNCSKCTVWLMTGNLYLFRKSTPFYYFGQIISFYTYFFLHLFLFVAIDTVFHPSGIIQNGRRNSFQSFFKISFQITMSKFLLHNEIVCWLFWKQKALLFV